MSTEDLRPRRALGFRHRVRLTGALIVLAVLVALCAWGIGYTLHGYSETLDSLAHWQARLEERNVEGAPRRPTGLYPPGARIQRLEKELDAVPGRLFAMGVVFVLATVLLVAGYRVLRRDRRAS